MNWPWWLCTVLRTKSWAISRGGMKVLPKLMLQYTTLFTVLTVGKTLCMERYLDSGLLCWRQRNRPFGNGESHALRIFFGGLKDSQNSFTLLLVNVCVCEPRSYTHFWNHMLSPFRLLPHVLNIADNHLVQLNHFSLRDDILIWPREMRQSLPSFLFLQL